MCPVVPSWNRIYSVLGAPDSVGHGGIGLDRAVELGSFGDSLTVQTGDYKAGISFLFCGGSKQSRARPLVCAKDPKWH